MMMTLRRTTGFMPIQRNVQSARRQLKKMAVAIMLSVEIRYFQLQPSFFTFVLSHVVTSFAGFVWLIGSRMDLPFIIVIVTTKPRERKHVNNR